MKCSTGLKWVKFSFSDFPLKVDIDNWIFTGINRNYMKMAMKHSE